MPDVSAWWMLLALLTGACVGMVGIGLLRSGRANLEWDREYEPVSGMPPVEDARAASNVLPISGEASFLGRHSPAPRRYRRVSGSPADHPAHRTPYPIHRLQLSGGRKR
jgi:hypothetical protein